MTNHFKKLIIFCSSKARVDEVFEFLTENNFENIGAIHSDIDTELRQENCKKFLSDKINILITTDLASRGLNMNAEYIIHYDISDKDTMIHRRGRCKKNGTVISFYTMFETNYFTEYQQDPENAKIYSVGALKSKELNTSAENSYNKLKRMLPKYSGTIDTKNLELHSFFRKSDNSSTSLKSQLRKTIDTYKKEIKKSKNTYQDQFFIPYNK